MFATQWSHSMNELYFMANLLLQSPSSKEGAELGFIAKKKSKHFLNKAGLGADGPQNAFSCFEP